MICTICNRSMIHGVEYSIQRRNLVAKSYDVCPACHFKKYRGNVKFLETSPKRKKK